MKTAEKFIAFKTLVRKEVLRFSRIWVQTLFPPVMTTALYFVVFGSLIGSRIGEMNGQNYIDFIVPGLVLMQIILGSYMNVVSSFFQAKFMKHIEEMLVSPMSSFVTLCGYVVGGVTRGVMIGIAVMVVSLFFTDLQVHSILITLLVALLTAVLFSLAGLVNGIYAKKFDDVSIVPNFILTPLTFLGGIFYSVTLLPDFWQTISLANPILYMINAFRYGILGVSDINVWIAIGMIIMFIIVLFTWAMYLLKKGVGIRN